MTQGEKELLLKDLCSRLPYNPMVEYKGETYNVLGITRGRLVLCKPFMSYTHDEHPPIEEVKLHLFSMSSMTEEQKEEFVDIGIREDLKYIEEPYKNEIRFSSESLQIDWLNKNHFDYRGLIGKCLAIDATNKNIY